MTTETKGRDTRHLILWALLAVSFAVCYFSYFEWLVYKFERQDSYYSHGYFIPFVTALLVYLKRKDIMRSGFGSDRAGLLVIGAALLIRIFGVLGDVNFISGFSMVLYIIGCSLYLLGRQVTGIIIYRLLYLVFMLPLPGELINIIALPFKSAATSIALWGMDILDVPYVREGFIVHLPTATFVVGTPCNGMRSLISFASLAALMLYMFRTSLWKKVVFLAVIPPLALLLNGVRVFLLLWIAHRFGQEAATPESYLHDGSGMLVFFVGFLIIVLLVRKINEKKTS